MSQFEELRTGPQENEQLWARAGVAQALSLTLSSGLVDFGPVPVGTSSTVTIRHWLSLTLALRVVPGLWRGSLPRSPMLFERRH